MIMPVASPENVPMHLKCPHKLYIGVGRGGGGGGAGGPGPPSNNLRGGANIPFGPPPQ